MKNSITAVLLAGFVLWTESTALAEDVKRSVVPGEIVVCFQTETNQVDREASIDAWNLSAVDAGFVVEMSKTILQWRRPGRDRFTNLVLIKFPQQLDSEAFVDHLEKIEGVDWCAPNTVCTGNVKELVPDDPQYGSQYHHPLMQNDLAWDITLGDPSVIIAITDDGFEVPHGDLNANIWVNPGETPADGMDNDSNGYIDDVNGWDVVHDNNDPNPDNSGDDHGTHVAGIAAAGTNNTTGVSGTAGAATILPIQFYDGNNSGLWTAAVIAESFAYAVDNGARIICTSYNINGWVGDPVFTAGLQYLYDQGGLHFNSAGNGSQLNPPRQVFHQTFLVANTDASDVKSGTSNYGTGIDFAAPGSSILSTVLNNGYGTKSGTSMAAPNAGGVAALIWSANPTWTREQVVAQMHATADNIDAQNPTLVGLLGAGRVNSFAALSTGSLPPPQVIATSLPSDGTAGTLPDNQFSIKFDQIMAPASINAPGAFSMTYAGPDATFGTGDDEDLPLTWPQYLIAANEIVITVGVGGLEGRYRVRADAAIIENPFGAKLDGNADGTPGDSWESTFAVCSTFTPTNCSTCAGDMDGSIGADGRDIGQFVDCVIDGSAATPGCGCADLDLNGVIDFTDVSLFIDLLLDAPLGLPFVEPFLTTTFISAKWETVNGAEIDGIGIAMPSPPYAARFNGDPSGDDSIVTQPINLDGQTAVRLTYQYQQTGGGESPDAGDDLFIEFLDNSFQWQLLSQHFGANPDMSTFQPVDILLPASAFHEDFQLRFRCDVTAGPYDDWLVDDINLTVADAPTATGQEVNTPQFVPVDITLVANDPNGDPLDYMINSLPANGILTDPGAGVINTVPYTLVNQGDVVNYAPSPPNFQGNDAFTFQATDGQHLSNTATVDVTVGGPVPVWQFLVDNQDPGWTTTGQWAFGQPTGGGSGTGDPFSGFTGINVYGYNLAGDYPSNMGVEHLTTTAIDCSGLVNTELRFRRWMGIESSTYDHAAIEISNDGSNWVLLWDHTGATFTESSWSEQIYDISAVADGQATVFIRWAMGTTDGSVTFFGWNLDDIEIWGITP